MLFLFDFAEVVSEHPIQISGHAKNLKEAREYAKYAIDAYRETKNVKPSEIRKLIKNIELVEPKITKPKRISKEWAVHVWKD